MLVLALNAQRTIESMVQAKDPCIESNLKPYDQTLTFQVLSPAPFALEDYIQTDRQEYVVKEIVQNDDPYDTITATLNLEEFEGSRFSRFLAEKRTAKECVDLAIAGTKWKSVSYVSDKKKRNIDMTNISAHEILSKIIDVFVIELEFDTLSETVYIREKIGSDKGAYFIKGMNLKAMTKTSDSYDYYTQIVPIGADGLKIEEINNNKDWLENFSYSKKVKTFIWEDSSYTEAEALKEDAQLKLNEMAKPKTSYTCDVVDLAKQSAEYDILSYSVGDEITLVGDTSEKQRIVKTTEYPDDYTANTCELSNTVWTFEEYQKAWQSAAAAVQNITSSNGTIKGSAVDTITVEQVDDFGEQVIISYDSSDSYAKTQDHIEAIDAKIGDIEATTITAAEADIKYAQIDFVKANYAEIDLANIKDGCITNAMLGSAVVDTGNIVDASITDAKIVGLTANKITAGRIDASDIEVVNLNAANITVGTINGQQIAPNTITADNLTEDLTLELSIKCNASQIIDKDTVKTLTLTAIVKDNGKEVDKDGTIYNYSWYTQTDNKNWSNYLKQVGGKTYTITVDDTFCTDSGRVYFTIDR